MSASRSAKAIASLIDRTNGLVGWPAFMAMMLLGALVCFEVFMRYVLNSPTIWSSEVTCMLQVTLASLGAGWVLKEEGHVCIDVLLTKLNHKWQCYLNAFNSVLGVLYCAGIAWLTWQSFAFAFRMGSRTEALGLLLWPTKIIVVIGFTLFGLQFIARGYKYYHLAQEPSTGAEVSHG